ncbi:MAG: sigma 54-interacting transcriptional regulator [Tissierellia bacterium]|nr:sigma 54-interacting transcriptional regulator [Tissierellia bacterium]
MKVRKIKITTHIDRPHLTYEFLSVLYRNNIPLLNLEVHTCVGYYILPEVDDHRMAKAIQEMRGIKECRSIEEVKLVPFEERDLEMKKVMDVIPQGVLILNSRGHIKYANDYAVSKIFNISMDQIVDKAIIELIDNDKLRFFMSNEGLEAIETLEVMIGNQIYQMNIKPIMANEGDLSSYMVSLSEMANQDIYYNPISFDDIIGESNKINEVISQAKLYARSDSPVLIVGESGTGKEIFARAIHNLSNRRDKPFIGINCAAIPEQLLESELFGYEAGSFTGGRKEGKKGLFEIGQGGTIFLDEIGDMPPHLQTKLLRVLQEKKIRKIGGHKEIPIDVRIISATNQNIEELINEGKFRLDLYYRINIFTLEIPALRNRKDDIPILVEYFTEKHSKRYGKIIDGIEAKAMKKLVAYNWPGNIRELQNVVERAVALSAGNFIQEKDIILNSNIEVDMNIPVNLSLKDMVGEYERDIIIRVLRNSRSIREAARKLKVTPTLLSNRIRKYKIDESEWRKNG